MKKYKDDGNLPIIKIKLNKEDHTKAFDALVEALTKNNTFPTKEEAEKYVENEEIRLELYYDKYYGFFAVETEAIDLSPTYNPFTGEIMDEPDEN